MNMSTRIEAFFSYGFRPFFLVGSMYAVIAILPWVGRFMSPGGRGIPGLPIPTTAWHAHEMLFGFAAAIIAGFFLTAVPSWTNRQPVSGLPLGALVLVWVLGRVVNWMPEHTQPFTTAIIDIAFIPFLVALVIRALIAGWSKRNLIFLPIFAGLFAANVMIHLDRLGIVDGLAAQGHRLALDLIIALIIILGGRVIPSFTTNYLRNHGETSLPAQSDRMTQLAVLSAAVMVIVNQVAPDTTVSGVVYILMALINAGRFIGWRGHRIIRVPILWILFAGYGFVIAGLVASAGAILGDALPRAAADHLLTIGGIGCMTLGIMTRASLGHTGRTPKASLSMIIAFLSVSAASLVRALGPAIAPDQYSVFMVMAGILWVVAFTIFTLKFFTILTTPRPMNRP